MKQTEEQKYSLIELEEEELEQLRKLPQKPANGYWFVTSQALKDLAKDYEKCCDDFNPTLIYKGDER